MDIVHLANRLDDLSSCVAIHLDKALESQHIFFSSLPLPQ